MPPEAAQIRQGTCSLTGFYSVFVGEQGAERYRMSGGHPFSTGRMYIEHPFSTNIPSAPPAAKDAQRSGCTGCSEHL
jgi:hypothetical protein